MKHFIIAVVALLAAVVGALSFQALNKPELPEFALYYQPARMVKPFQLADQQGKSFTQAQLQGKWSWLFFGYTSCPDVCPTTLQALNYIYPELQSINSTTQVLFVSVDPKRDSQAKLAQYINYFNDDFFALRAGHEVLFPFARNLGLMYAITDREDGQDYLVDHSASIVLVNPHGNIAAIFKPEQAVGQVPSVDGKKLVQDFIRIVHLFEAKAS
jgi:protein SCO1